MKFQLKPYGIFGLRVKPEHYLSATHFQYLGRTELVPLFCWSLIHPCSSSAVFFELLSLSKIRQEMTTSEVYRVKFHETNLPMDWSQVPYHRIHFPVPRRVVIQCYDNLSDFFSQYNIEYKGHKLNVEEKKPRGERTHSGSRPGIRRDGPRFNHRGGRGGGFGGPPREDSGNRDQGRFSNVNKANMNRR